MLKKKYNGISAGPLVFKFGCNWRGCPNSFYSFIKENEIVIGSADRTPYAVGDLVLIAEGFQVKAIAKILTPPKPITAFPEFAVITEEFWIDYEPSTIIATAEWYELPANKGFEYRQQRGAVRVRNTPIIERALQLWNTRQ